jgi:hypothetical protein
MNTKEFNGKYRNKGGMNMLARMRADLSPQKVISHHFGVSQEAVRKWMLEFFGEKYDPRLQRREISIERMVQFYKDTSMESFKRAYRGSAYYQRVIKIIQE